MTTTYKISIRGITGSAYAMYDEGVLRMFINEIDRHSQFYTLLPSISVLQVELLRATGISVQELKAKSAADKIAMFTFFYKKHKNVAYRATKQERANITDVTVNEQVLNTYFTTTQYPLAGTKSITDFVKHYNEIRDLATNGRPVKIQSFPDYYDKDYVRTIGDNSAKLELYWGHLRSLGFKFNDGVWTKPQQP